MMHLLLRSLCVCLLVVLAGPQASGAIQRKKFTAPGRYLIVEILDEDLLHVEVSAVGSGPDITKPLYTSPMVLRTDYPGPSTFVDGGGTLETSVITVTVDAQLAVTVRDKLHGNAVLTQLAPLDLDQPLKRLQIAPGAMQNVYGLGQRLLEPKPGHGRADGDWLVHGAREGGPFGNEFSGFGGGMVGNVQIPIMYAVGANDLGYALFLDNVYRQTWDFARSPWTVSAFGDQLRFYVMAGPSLLDLRRDYLELTGTPPVPPRKAFGLWVSEFGYDDFDQIRGLRDGLRQKGFPVDGFVLDLNWFGGVVPSDAEQSRMGRLNWDESQNDGNAYFFPKPGQAIRAFAEDHVALAVIEESYVSEKVDTFNDMPKERMVYQRANGQCDIGNQSNPSLVTGFWGKGRMIDWSDPGAATFIHDQRRLVNVVRKGVNVHWTDLGEPETKDDAGCYDGIETVNGDLKNEHPDLHNLYNLLWNRSIWDGYFTHRNRADDLGQRGQRPFILTRSGAAGTQRFGAAMWSGDIGSNLESLATHLNAQLHMSFSGIDYYGADVGGFRRESMPHNDTTGKYRGYEEELYTEWFANACWFDVPVRPHTDNEFVKVTPPYDTSPHRVGKLSSNLANLRQRYELIPYYYSLAYRAHIDGEPLVAPLVVHYPNDPRVRTVGHQKLIGRDLLIGVVARHGEYERDMYLPAGSWVNYHTNEWFHGTRGRDVASVPVYRDGLFRLPAFARAGALLPQMHVDDRTKDAFGHRKAGSTPRTELIVRAFASPVASAFTLFEDDGRTLNYDAKGRPSYHHRTTQLRQQQVSAGLVRVEIAPAVGVGGGTAIAGLPNSRRNVVRLSLDNSKASAVALNGTPLAERSTEAAFAGATSGWRNAGPNLVEAKSSSLAVTTNKVFEFSLESAAATSSVSFVCDNGGTRFGESIYVSGDIPALGNSNPTQAVKLEPSIYYEYIWNPPPGPGRVGPVAPVWTGVIDELPPNTTFHWKCLRKREDDTGTPQVGPSQTFSTAASGYAGRTSGSL
jgi:alpha-glucosidase (family GH31 glycosyl hydrolase)